MLTNHVTTTLCLPHLSLFTSLDRQVLPTHLENYRNPCFYERERNISECRKGPFTELSSHAGEDNTTKLNTQHRLSCLPYFFVAGFPRSGAVDVMKRLTRHPDVTVPHQTSSEWLNRYRYGRNCVRHCHGSLCACVCWGRDC